MVQSWGSASNKTSCAPLPESSPRPKNWPHDLPYLNTLIYTPSLDSQRLNVPRASLSPLDVIVNPAILRIPASHVRITRITNPSHPAHGQHGLFATQQLAPSSFIVLYLGIAHLNTESDPQSDYDLSLDRESGVSVDASQAGNEARFVNDYRGVRREGPNAEFRDVWIEMGKGSVGRRIGVFVLGAGKSRKKSKGIMKGEEIVISYGKGFWNERNKEAKA